MINDQLGEIINDDEIDNLLVHHGTRNGQDHHFSDSNAF